MAFMVNQNLPYWQQQAAVQANMAKASAESEDRRQAREAVTQMSAAINRQPSANSTNPGIGAIVPYTPPVFDPRLATLAVESCQKNGGYCGDAEGIGREAIAKATTADKLAYDKSVAAKIAANFAREAKTNKSLQQVPSQATATAAVQAAAAVPDARAATNPTSQQTPKETGAKVDTALKKHKADVAKVKKGPSNLKAKNKKAFAKGIAKMKKKNRGR